MSSCPYISSIWILTPFKLIRLKLTAREHCQDVHRMDRLYEKDFSVCERRRVTEAVCQLLWCPTVIIHMAGFNLLISRQKETDSERSTEGPRLKNKINKTKPLSFINSQDTHTQKQQHNQCSV